MDGGPAGWADGVSSERAAPPTSFRAPQQILSYLSTVCNATPQLRADGIRECFSESTQPCNIVQALHVFYFRPYHRLINSTCNPGVGCWLLLLQGREPNFPTVRATDERNRLDRASLIEAYGMRSERMALTYLLAMELLLNNIRGQCSPPF